MSSSTKTRERHRTPPADSRPIEQKSVKSPKLSAYVAWKPWLDRPIAAVLFIPSIFVIAVLIVLVRLTSPGPAIFRQQRVGRGGRLYTMYKIRTMRQDAEAATGAVWAQQGDPRVTPVGRVLRKLHLDEFPQLINVLKGDMSLIGPRPERPEFTQQLAVKLPGYLDRLMVLPGITGLAQINLPPDTDLESVRRKLRLDLRYIEEANFWLDLRMALCTATRIIGVPGDFAMRAFRLRRPSLEDQGNSENFALQSGSSVEPQHHGARSHLRSAPSGNGHSAIDSAIDADEYSLPAVSTATDA